MNVSRTTPTTISKPEDETRNRPAEDAAAGLPPGARVLLTVGHRKLDVYLARTDCSFVVRSIDFPYACAAFEPSAELAAGAQAVGRPGSKRFKLLVQEAEAPRWAERLPGWSREDVVLHRYEGSGRTAVPPEGAEIRWIAPHTPAVLPLEAAPEDLRAELSLALDLGLPMAAAFVDERPVSFCYAALTTERLWDVAVATLETYRRRGLAGAAFEEVRRHLALRGKQPVWGAMASNQASLGLARRLGFVEDSRLVALRPPGAEPE